MHPTERREFLLGATAALMTSSRSNAAEREVRTAMVGIGKRGSTLLGQVLQQPGVKVTAICEHRRKSAGQCIDHSTRR